MTRTLIHASVLIFSLLLGGNVAIWLGKELCWDLANYHFYNPYAFFHARAQLDFWPTSFIHQYISPTIDFLSYFLIRHVAPLHVVFILGALHGLNLWLIYLISCQFLSLPFAILIAVISLYGPVVLPGMGSFQNDNLVSLFVLGFVYLHLLALRYYELNQQLPVKLVLISGLVLGLGAGLKLTAGIFVVGAMLALLISPIPKSRRVQWLLLWLVATVIGTAIVSGYWMFGMWRDHHNPVFPFFNHLFHSPDFVASNWFDPRFFPQGFWQHLAYPFYFAWDGRIADQSFLDFRYLITYILFAIMLLQWVWNKYTAREVTIDSREYWLCAFFIFSYLGWQYYFSIARYIVTLEMLAPLMIYLLLKNIFNSKTHAATFFVLIIYILVAFMSPTAMVRTFDYSGSFFNVTLPRSVKTTPQATVLMAYSIYALSLEPRPQSYLIPFFPHDWRFVGIPFADTRLILAPKDKEKINATLMDKYPIFLLASDFSMPQLVTAAREFGLAQQGECEKIYSDRQSITHQDVLICPVLKQRQ